MGLSVKLLAPYLSGLKHCRSTNHKSELRMGFWRQQKLNRLCRWRPYRNGHSPSWLVGTLARNALYFPCPVRRTLSLEFFALSKKRPRRKPGCGQDLRTDSWILNFQVCRSPRRAQDVRPGWQGHLHLSAHRWSGTRSARPSHG